MTATRSALDRAGEVVFGLAALAWVVVLGLILRHRLYLSLDSVSNYAHIWYVADRLSGGHGLAWRMPIIGHGEAFSFPYGFVPWVTAALAWPLLGEWGVTLWLVLGSVGLVVATLWALPELGRGWWAAAVLVNPALVMAPIIGQLPFIWASAMLMVAIGAWRRERRWLAAVMAGLAQATHPAVVLPIALVLVAAWWWLFERDRRALVRYCLVSLVPVVPATWFTLASPVMSDASATTKLSNFVGTLGVRVLVFAWPIALCFVVKRHRLAPAAFALALVMNLAFVGPLNLRFAWRALGRSPDTALVPYLDSPAFVPGATYRVLRVGDAKVSMYQVIRRGGRLDSEFFPESIDRGRWVDGTVYARFLRKRAVDYVVVFRDYDARYGSNEHALLARMSVNHGPCPAPTVGVDRVASAAQYDVFAVHRSC